MLFRSLRNSEIGKITEIDRSSVSARLKPFSSLPQNQEINDKIMADKILSVAWNIISSIEPDVINKSPLSGRAVSFGIMMDKFRLLTGKSTANISLHTHHENSLTRCEGNFVRPPEKVGKKIKEAIPADNQPDSPGACADTD